jgi:hypothetical protein
MRKERAIRPALERGAQEARTSIGTLSFHLLALVVLRSQFTEQSRTAERRFPDTGFPGRHPSRPNAGHDDGPVGPALREPLQRPARLSASPPSLENDSF